MGTAFQLYVAGFSILLIAASLIVLTSSGQALIIRAMRAVGSRSDVGPWAFRRHAGVAERLDKAPTSQVLLMAESYVAKAEAVTIRDARVVLWVLIGGCLSALLAGLVITAVLPPFVVSGAWTYDAYRNMSLLVVRVTVAGGVLAAVVLAAWLLRDASILTDLPECEAAAYLVTRVRDEGVDAELGHQLAVGPFPRLRTLLHARG